jgi:uncharacterized protein (TIGR02145 family)
MVKFIFYLLIILSSLPLFAQQEPLVKIYQTDGSTKQYNLADIADMSFIHSNLSYSMSVFQKDNSKISYDIRLISSINFVDNQKLLIKYGFEPTIYNISEIDSIIFTFNTCTEIQIGNQIWMCKNLDVDHYRNGDSIPEVRDSIEWSKLKTGAWCYYNNDPELGKIYGKLYNWYAVNDARGLAPEGWHIPSDSEWTELVNFLGKKIAGNKLKETGTIHWGIGNNEATNESGFTALPSGIRSYYGSFYDNGFNVAWWSSSIYDTKNGWFWILLNDSTYIERSIGDIKDGFSIRCIKDK